MAEGRYAFAMLTSRSPGHKVLTMWSSSSSIAALRLVFGFAGPACLAGSVMEYRHGPAAPAAAAANRHCLELYTRVYKSRHPSSLLSLLLPWLAVRGSLLRSSSYAAPSAVWCGPCLLLRPLLSVSSHLDPSFNRLCRICLAPLTFPQNPPARLPPAIQPAARAHSLTRPDAVHRPSPRRNFTISFFEIQRY